MGGFGDNATSGVWLATLVGDGNSLRVDFGDAEGKSEGVGLGVAKGELDVFTADALKRSGPMFSDLICRPGVAISSTIKLSSTSLVFRSKGATTSDL
jgi:hypothetical protein